MPRMKIENSFRVDLPLERAWATLLDIPSLVPCMPGAELLAVEDDGAYRGQVKVKLGPVAVAFRGRARLDQVDEAQHMVRAKASGTEEKGRGSAQADVTFRLSPDGAGTRVDAISDIVLAGAVAQYGRAQGVIADVAQVMIDTFARNLGRMIESSQPAATPAGETAGSAASSASTPAPPPAPAPAISVFALFLALVRRWFARFKEKRSQ
jgi:carbon monoxide dehydrogenase subunit G